MMKMIKQLYYIVFFLLLTFNASSQSKTSLSDTIFLHENHICIREYYGADEKRIKKIYSIDQKNNYQGTEIQFEYSGFPKLVRTFKDNKLHGIYVNYFNGKILIYRHFSKDMLNGYYCEYDYSGKKETEGHYNENNKVGEWFEYHPSGTVKSKGQYIDSSLFVKSHKKGNNFKLALTNNKGDTLEVFDYIEAPIDSLIQFFNLTSGFRHESQRYTLPLDIYFKTGKWYYYDEEGELEKVEFYDRGKFIKVITEKEK